MDYKRFGQRIRDYRVKSYITQEKMAEAVGLSANFISQIETGIRKPSLETIIAIANALGVSVDCLLKDSIVANEDVKINELLTLLEGRSEGELSLVIDTVRAMFSHTKDKL